MTEQKIPENLTDLEALKRIEKYGFNELPRSKREGYFTRIVKLFKEPMILLLIATAGVYLIMGDLEEGILLSCSVLVVIGISLYQEIKSENAIESLREL